MTLLEIILLIWLIGIAIALLFFDLGNVRVEKGELFLSCFILAPAVAVFIIGSLLYYFCKARIKSLQKRKQTIISKESEK
jgi:hypothetical protein